MPGAQSARERLQNSLVRLSRGAHRSAPRSRRSGAFSPVGPAGNGGPPASPITGTSARAEEPSPEGVLPRDLAVELLERLERIEERLADIQRPVRPVPATREIFAEWVRLRQWEEIAFGDFLKLRRSGLV